VVFDHPTVSKSWLTYRVCRHEEEEDAYRIETILNIETTQSGPAEGKEEEWDELIDALTTFLSENDEVDSVDISPVAQGIGKP